MKRLVSLVFSIACVAAAPAARARAITLSDTVRVELERATARLEKLREAYEAGAISRKELEEAEAGVRDLERRIRQASGEQRELNVGEAERRVEDARADFQKAEAKAKRLRELYDAGAASRNDAEAAEAVAARARTYYELNQELSRRLTELATMPMRSQQNGSGGFSIGAFFNLQDAYFDEFQHVLPVSAFGPSETHERMGFDHEGRIDVALHPDSAEGRWLVAQLEVRNIPFIAFRNAIPGKATGPHIHLGFPSPVVARH